MSFDCKLFFPIANEFTEIWAPQAYRSVSTVLTLFLHPHCEGFAYITAVDYNANQRVLTFNPLTKCEQIVFEMLL